MVSLVTQLITYNQSLESNKFEAIRNGDVHSRIQMTNNYGSGGHFPDGNLTGDRLLSNSMNAQ